MHSNRPALQVCLNGSRHPDEHPGVPITPEELAAAARSAVDAGADTIHMHPRGSDGSESLAAKDIAAGVGAVRLACGTVPIGVSTGLWITGHDRRARHTAVAGWAGIPASQRPDFASVNLSEPGFTDLTRVLQRARIGVEPGVWSVSDADVLTRVRPYRPWMHILIEVLHKPLDVAHDVADAILDRLDALEITGERLLHGENPTSWPLLKHAGKLHLATRIGLEDVLIAEDDSPVDNNAELVRLALACLV